MKRFLPILSVLAFCAAATPAPVLAEPKPDDQVRQVLLARNGDLRQSLMKTWMASAASADPAKLRTLIVDLYASEARLTALGIERIMIQEGAALSEVPYFVLAERSRTTIDPWTPFAGRTFAVPKEALR